MSNRLKQRPKSSDHPPMDLPKHIMVIDNDPTIHQLIKTYCSGLMIRDIACFTDSLQALSEMRRFVPDLLILDWRSKPTNADIILQRIQEDARFQRLPIIILAGQLNRLEMTTINSRPRTISLHKPFVEEIFLEAMARFYSDALPQKKTKDSSLQIHEGSSDPGRGLYLDKGSSGSSFLFEDQLEKKDSHFSLTDNLQNHGNFDFMLDPNYRISPGEVMVEGDYRHDPRLQDIRKVLLVETDSSQRVIMSDILHQMKIPSVNGAENGSVAWDFLKHSYFDLVLLDWRCKNPSALAIYNRLRQNEDTFLMPIIITCSKTSREDFRIIEDHPATILFEKPYSPLSIDTALKKIYRQITQYNTSNAKVADKIDDAITADTSVMKAIEEIVRNDENPIQTLIASAHYLMECQRYSEAEKVYTAILRTSPNNLQALTNLGKILYLHQRSDEAYGLLSKAQLLSPQNVQRLCTLGEVGFSLEDPEKAASHFKAALSIDNEDPRAAAGMVAADSYTDYLVKRHLRSDVSRHITSVLNLIAISHIKEGNLELGVSQYKAALVFISDSVTQAKVEFNLGLAYLKSHRLQESREWFQKSQEHGGRFFVRANDLLERIDRLSPIEIPEEETLIIDITNTSNLIPA